MAKTLADMTAEERAECVGMWCDNLASTADTPQPVVLACVQGERCWILHTDLHGEWSCFPLDRVAPRFDLPRVWTPDGEPDFARALAKETWEYAVQVKIGAKWLFLGRGAGGHSFAKNAFWFDKKEKAQGYQLIRGETAPTRIVRRRVSPPEVIDE